MEKTNYTFIEKIGELSEDGIAVYDTEAHKFVYVNNNFLEIFNMKEGRDSLFKSSHIILECLLSEDLAYLKSRYKELLETGCINTTEFRLKFKDENIKHLSCDVLMLDSPNLITAFVKDISKLKQHEDYLIKYMAQKDTMLDMLTHNLSGPLFLTKDVISSLKDGMINSESMHATKLIHIIQENTQQCIDIVNDFLREEHSESAHTFVKKTRFDVLEKISVTLDKLRSMNDDKTFKLTSEVLTVNINSDPVKFFQVIHNVLSNAIKFTHPGGCIEILVTENKTHYVISISDDGIGIPQDMKANLFKEKSEGRRGLKGEKSSGLGLSIAKRLINLMGGTISFESDEQKGTNFFISLPKE